MHTIFLAMESELLVLQQQEQRWTVTQHLVGKQPQCLAVDSIQPQRIYCGTFDFGMWRSDDGGAAWHSASDGVQFSSVMAVASAATNLGHDYAVAYLGTEPSRMYRTEDGGTSWHELEGLTALPSASTWSFPPRPHTHHVRAIAIDPHDPLALFVCIEAGALVRSRDGGQSWEDRVPGSPIDTHTLVLHPQAPGRLYAAAGDGYFESEDGGATWARPRAGLSHHYMWSVAIDVGDPEIMVVSASSGPYTAHNPTAAQSFIYRRSGGEAWQPISDGLPAPQGTTRSVLTTCASEPGVFYAANNHGVFRSSDQGQHWSRLDIAWPEAYRMQTVQALLATDEVGSAA